MRVLTMFVAVGITLAALWLGLEFAREILRLYRLANADVRLGVLTAGGSAAAFVINNAVQSARERQARIFESKREAYAAFFQSFCSFFQRSNSASPVDPNELVLQMQAFTVNLMTWGSSASINAFNQYQRENAVSTSTDPKDLSRRIEKLLRVLRKDLGHSDSGLKNLSLMKLMIKGGDHADFD